MGRKQLTICGLYTSTTGLYLWSAIPDGREHVLTNKHKQVTITEIMWQNDKALERLRIEINSTIA